MIGKISEIFDSVQGEGIYLGEKQIFIRLFGCNMNCEYCDTKKEYYREYYVEELFNELKAYREKYHSISFTGGEPLLQKDFLKEAMVESRKRRIKNYLETNGTLTAELKEVIDYVDIIAMDLKLPSSTEQPGCWQEHRDFLKVAKEKEIFLKCVVCKDTKEEDFRKSLELIKEANCGQVLVLQPDSRQKSEDLKVKIEQFRNICFEEGITVCSIPQVHKILGVK
jgi:organic radical activating enzyme